MRDKQKIIEEFASMEHDRWAKWQSYVHKNLYNIQENEPERWKELKNPHLKILPTELYERWERQIHTPYSELSDQEKESDRKQVYPYIKKMEELIAHAIQEERDRVIRIADRIKCRTNVADDESEDYWIDYEELIEKLK